MLALNHLKLIEGDLWEMKAVRRWILGAVPGGECSGINVLHQADDSCCRREAWDDTLARILGALGIKDFHAINFDWRPFQ